MNIISVFPVDGNKLFKSNNAGVYFLFPKKGNKRLLPTREFFCSLILGTKILFLHDFALLFTFYIFFYKTFRDTTNQHVPQKTSQNTKFATISMTSDNDLSNNAMNAIQLIAAARILAAREGGDLPEISEAVGDVDGGDVGDGQNGGKGGKGGDGGDSDSRDGGDGGGSGGDNDGNNLPDQPQICSRKGCQAVGIRPISSMNPALYCLACLKMKRDAKTANRSKKRRQVRQKKCGLMGHITCK